VLPRPHMVLVQPSGAPAQGAAMPRLADVSIMGV